MLIKFWILKATPDPKPTWGIILQKSLLMFLELNSASLEFLKISCFLLLENQAY
jgi:hypothetical protein